MLARKPDAVVAVPIVDRDALAEVKAAGLISDRLVAMVRLDKVDAAFIPKLETLGVTMMSGTYGGPQTPDPRPQTPDPRPQTPDIVYRTVADAVAFHALAKAGPRMIVSNRSVEAATAMLADPTYAQKLKACGIGR